MTTTAPQTSSREPVSYERVAAVCEALRGTGERVSVRRVQAEVGGSNTTILNHLRRWQDVQRSAAAAGTDDGLFTPAVRAALAAWAQDLAAAARSDAEQRTSELEELYSAANNGWETADARVATLETQLEEVRAAADKAAREHGEKLAASDARAAAAERQVVELQEQVAREQKNAETSRMAAAEAKIKADAAAEGIKTLGDENKAMREELRALHKGTAQAEQRAAVAEERAQNRDEQLTELRGAFEALRKTGDELQGRLATAEKARSEAERDLAVCKSERAALERARAAPHPTAAGAPETTDTSTNQSKQKGKAP